MTKYTHNKRLLVTPAGLGQFSLRSNCLKGGRYMYEH